MKTLKQLKEQKESLQKIQHTYDCIIFAVIGLTIGLIFHFL